MWGWKTSFSCFHIKFTCNIEHTNALYVGITNWNLYRTEVIYNFWQRNSPISAISCHHPIEYPPSHTTYSRYTVLISLSQHLFGDNTHLYSQQFFTLSMKYATHFDSKVHTHFKNETITILFITLDIEYKMSLSQANRVELTTVNQIKLNVFYTLRMTDGDGNLSI